MHRIARARGFAHPKQLTAGLSSSQITELIAFERVEPTGYAAAHQSATLAACIRSTVPQKGHRGLKAEDWLPTMLKLGPDPPRQAADWGAALLRALASSPREQRGRPPEWLLSRLS